jgi:hypothetical protein
MVYCTNCGTRNDDEATNCVNCGEPIRAFRPGRRDWEGDFERRVEDFGERAERFGKQMESECFGLPHGSTIFGIFFGLLIIIFGLQMLYGWDIDIGPFAAIMVGILIVAGTLYGYNQRKTR